MTSPRGAPAFLENRKTRRVKAAPVARNTLADRRVFAEAASMAAWTLMFASKLPRHGVGLFPKCGTRVPKEPYAMKDPGV